MADGLPDQELLRRYARDGSEPAFRELVERHVDLVYGAAFRRLNNRGTAEEVTQTVFALMAGKATSLANHPSPAGWLYHTAVNQARLLHRGEQRRQLREATAAQLANTMQANPSPDLGPELDDAMLQLKEDDRQALVLRYFEEMPVKQVGAALGIAEDTAQKRIARAIERLRHILGKRGVAVSGMAIVASLSAAAGHTAPAGLAANVAATAAVKGAVSSATIIKGAVMAWTKAKVAAVIGIGVLLVAGTATVTVTKMRHREKAEALVPDAVAAQVLEVLGGNEPNRFDGGAGKIMAMGPGAVTCLGEILSRGQAQMQRDFEKMWPGLPDALKEKLRRLGPWNSIFRQAGEAVWRLGPAGARPLTSALAKGLGKDRGFGNEFITRALFWSLPDSPETMKALTNWLANPAHAGIFGWVEADKIWPQIPQTMPLLIPWLGNEYAASEAARALGEMGSNAAPAIPALIQVCDNGVANPRIQPEITMGFGPGLQPIDRNRSAAFAALGKIGIASPEVLQALDRGFASADEGTRFGALVTLSALHQPLGRHLMEVLNSLAVRRSYYFLATIQNVGGFGGDAREALPWLRKFTDLEYLKQLPEKANDNPQDSPREAEGFRRAAIIAMCKIEPEEIMNFLPDLTAQIGEDWDAIGLLMDSKVHGDEIAKSLEPLLAGTNGSQPDIAAYVILGVRPGHEGALKVLRRDVALGTLRQRMAVAHWLWKRTGETQPLLDLCQASLKANDGVGDQAAAIFLGEMGLQALPAVPVLKRALWSPDEFVRECAGLALRKIAPQELPEMR